MGIWSYSASRGDGPFGSAVTDIAVATDRCLYCALPLSGLASPTACSYRLAGRPDAPLIHCNEVEVCVACGWWRTKATVYDGLWTHSLLTVGNFGILKELDLADIETPVEEIRRYLVARFDRRFELHPRLFEETVASVMADFGFTAETTAYSNDGGIDVILHGDAGVSVGVQVKRYRNRITVEQIRSLMGALVLGGHTRGMFVTTSGFNRGAVRAASRSSSLGLPIELVDADGFLASLGVANRPMYTSHEEWAIKVRSFDLVVCQWDPA
jgi:hypothetical protein